MFHSECCNRISTIFTLLLTVSMGIAQAQEAEDEIQLMPADIGLGAELVVAITGRVPGGDFDLELVAPDGGRVELTRVLLDRNGNALARLPVPDVPPGPYTVELLSARGGILASADLTLLDELDLSFDKSSGVAGETLEVNVKGLKPGLLEITFDGIAVLGPETVAAGDFSAKIRIPGSGQSEVPVVATNRVGSRIIARKTELFQRNRTTRDRVAISSVQMPDRLLQQGEEFSLSGTMIMPDGRAPSEFDWTLALTIESGQRLPVNITPVEFSDPGQKGGSINWSVVAVLPSVKVNYPAFDLDVLVDELGFVYRNPETGEVDYEQLNEDVPYDDWESIIITGELVWEDVIAFEQEGDDFPETPVAGAIVSIEADTYLIDPNNPETIFDREARTDRFAERPSSHATAMLAPNQFSESLPMLFPIPGLTIPDDVTDTGCPITLALQETAADGTYQFAFSPEQTAWYSMFGDVELNPISGNLILTDEIADRFSVRVSAMHLDPAYGVPSGPNSFAGIRYDFERDDQSGIYKFRERPDGPFETIFNPIADTLKTTFYPVPPLAEQEIGSAIKIDGLPQPNPASGPGTAVFSQLVTFPTRKGTALDEATLTINLNWIPLTNGDFVGAVKFDGLPSAPFVPDLNADPCSPQGIVYKATVPGVATLGDPEKPGTTINGRITGNVGQQVFYKDIQLITKHGPNWFEGDKAAFYNQPVNIQWEPDFIRIRAVEVKKETDASANNVGLGIGSVENKTELESAFIEQIINNGYAQKLTRKAAPDVTAFGKTGSPKAISLSLDPAASTTFFAEIPLDLPLGLEIKPGLPFFQKFIDCPRAQDDTPDVGDCDPEIIFDTGKIPLFFYQWGQWPVAELIVGAEYYLKAFLLYFGYLDTLEGPGGAITVNSVIEPSVETGINVYLDFSAIFGLVSASLDFTPNVGVGTPVFIQNNLQTNAQGCFQFRLRLEFSIHVGPCPVCVGGSVTKTPINLKEPSNCQILGQGSKGAPRLAQALPSAVRLANNQFGSTFVVREEPDGIFVQAIQGGVPFGLDVFLSTGVGASQPDITFYAADRALAVWSESSLTESEFQALIDMDYECSEADVLANPDCNDQEGFDAYKYQHLMYSIWDGSSWSPAQNLTPSGDTQGEGGARLAACHESNVMCPPGGQALAVWHRELADDLSLHQIRLLFSIWDGFTWSAPQEVDVPEPPDSGFVKGVNPAPFYSGMGRPAVVWVRNDDPLTAQGGINTDNRRMAMRFLDAGNTEELAGLPGAVANPSVALTQSGQVILAYTASAPGDPFIGSRRALRVASSFPCSSSDMCWLDQDVRDETGRGLYVESPVVNVDASDTVHLAYRWLGTDGPVLESDPFGVSSFGAAAVMQFSLEELGVPQIAAASNPLIVDSGGTWKVGAVIDEVAGSLQVVSTQAAQLQGQQKRGFSAQPLSGVTTHKLAGRQTNTLFDVPSQSDLELVSAALVEGNVVAGDDVVTVRTVVANRGAPVGSSRVGLEAWWDGPPGVGLKVGEVFQIDPTTPAGTEVFLSMDVPPEVRTDEIHRLHVVVNPGREIKERNTANNTQIIVLNELPVPQDVELTIDFAGTTPLFDWDAVDDPRVVGWRAYRRESGTEDTFHIGMTPVPGFADLLALRNKRYDYCFASLSMDAQQSACSEWIAVGTFPARGEVIFGGPGPRGGGFE